MVIGYGSRRGLADTRICAEKKSAQATGVPAGSCALRKFVDAAVFTP
jgi:hypothetical protein